MTADGPDGRAKTLWICESCRDVVDGLGPRSTGDDFGGSPLSLVARGTTLARGIQDAEHQCEDRWIGHRSLVGCGEEEREWSAEPCGSCGDASAGARFAATAWTL